MVESIPAGVVGGGAQSEIGAEIDDCGAAGGDRRHEVCRRAVGQGQEDGIDRWKLAVDREPGGPEVGVDVREGLVVPVATLEPDDLDCWMAAQQPDQLRARVAGCPDDADPDPAVRAIRPAIRRDRD
jgi:hypothetical protein